MSVSATIDLRINATTHPLILTIIKLLLAAGWSVNYGGAVFYLPIGDDDDFDWQREVMSDVKLLEILDEKEKLGELVGITMIWRNSDIGGEFLFRSDGSISISLSINRKQIDEGFTDVNWYVSKIVPVLRQGGLGVESFDFSEHV